MEQVTQFNLPRAWPGIKWKALSPQLVTGMAFAILYWTPVLKLVRDWWNEPDAGHGLLLAPIAVWLAWNRGISPDARAQRVLGASMLLVAVLLRYVGGVAAELFTMRASLVGAVLALIVFWFGMRQLLHWWLPVALFILSIPLPTVVLSSIAFPLQLQASKMGAALLQWRDVPVLLRGNVIHLPGQTMFVTEACSGLRSLASLISLGVLIGGLWFRYPVTRVLLVLATLPVAILLNGVRVFLTGFLVYFVDPKLGDGFMHATEGWVIFVVAFGILGAMGWMLVQMEARVARRTA
jgi:exosortase